MTVVNAEVLERRRRMRENARLMDDRWAKLQADIAADRADIEDDLPPLEGVPHPDEVDEAEFRLPKSATLTWFRTGSDLMPLHCFKLSYPVGLDDDAKERIAIALKAMGWEQRWEAWSYVGVLSDEDSYRTVEVMLKMEVAKVFHRGDVPDLISGRITLRWSESKPDSGQIHCIISGLDELTTEKLQQFKSTIESYDGYLQGSSLTFPQIHSGDIVDSLKMAGFNVSQAYPSGEPHYIEISENAPIWVSGALGHEDWLFTTKGDFWEVRIGGSDSELFPRWSMGGRVGDSSFSAAALEFWQAEQLIVLAIQRYLGGHPEQPLVTGGIR